MHDRKVSQRPTMSWITVTDEQGRSRLEMRWSADVAVGQQMPLVKPHAA